jgi:arsenate reductase-like glutaredoxin family protein
METRDLDRLVKININPFTAMHFKTDHTSEELEAIFAEAAMNGDGDEIEKILENTVEIEISLFESIMFMTKNDLTAFLSLLNKCGIRYEMRNFTKDLFEMDNLNELLNNFKDDMNNLSDEEKELVKECFPNHKTQKEKATSIIKSIFVNNFTTDDVLDRISEKGFKSLNEFHKNILA